MQLILNSNMVVAFSVKYNCNISKSKLVFPLSYESYFSLIALLVQKLSQIKREHFFFGTPIDDLNCSHYARRAL